MTQERWTSLMNDDSLGLIPDEIAQGWHWCYDFDGLLVGPGMDELHNCYCPYPVVQQAKAKQPINEPPDDL